MKNKKTLSITAILFAVALVAAFVIFHGSRHAIAQVGPEPPPDPDNISFGMIGIANGQTARINIFNANSLDYESHPCSVNIRFVGSDGRVLRDYNGQPFRRVTTLPNGQSTSLELNYGDVPRINLARQQLRAVVTVTPPSDSTLPPGPCFPSVEVFNNANGRTQFMVPPRTIADPEG